MKHIREVLVSLACLAAIPAHALDTDAVIGGAVGGGVGAAVGSEIGGRDGAIAGSAIGAAIGTAAMTDKEHAPSASRHESAEVSRSGGPPAHAHRTPPGHAKHGKKHKWK